MGLEKVVERILRDSLEAEAKILSEAKAEAGAILEDAERRKAGILAGYRRKADTAVAGAEVREKARTEVEVSKVALAARKRILESVLAGAMERLRDMPDPERAVYYHALVAEAGKHITEGVIHCVEGEERFFPAVPGFKVIGDLDAPGGFIAESADGSVVMDMRLNELLRDVWDRMLARVYGQLFGGPESTEADAL